MKKNFRPDDPPKTVANEIIAQYEPPNSLYNEFEETTAFVNSRTDNWNKKTGAYSISIEWVYK
jgi:hypothetical protein